jgi:GNAT superfamily N-acetyltransferase
MAAISVERTIGKTKRAVLGGLIGYNTEKMGRQKYRRFAVSLRDDGVIVGGIVGEVWMTVLFIQFFWIEARFRGKGHGTALIEKIEQEARQFGAVRSYVDTMSVQAPAFYRACGYEAFGAIDGYPGGVTRHWFTKELQGLE